MSRAARVITTGCALGAFLGVAPLRAAEPEPDAPATDTRVHWGSLTVYSENDFYFAGTDRRYTNGFKVTALARDLRSFDQPGMWPIVRRTAALLGSFVPHHEIPQLAVSLGQNIYTPEDIHTPDPSPAERPYAAWLYAGAAFQAERPAGADRLADVLDTASLDLGVVGPWALGREIQNDWHQLFGLRQAEGWDHQLHNEFCPQLGLERKWRFRHRTDAPALAFAPGWNADFIPHVGAQLGTAFTHLAVGATARFGFHLPGDFGSDLIRPSGQATAATRPRFNVHVFVQCETRAVARDITLDGNTWRESPSVPRRDFVTDLVYGCSIGLRRVQLTYAQATRSREFRGQPDAQDFGSISLATYF